MTFSNLNLGSKPQKLLFFYAIIISFLLISSGCMTQSSHVNLLPLQLNQNSQHGMIIDGLLISSIDYQLEHTVFGISLSKNNLQFQSEEELLELIKWASKGEHPAALFSLGSLYMSGNRLPFNMNQAIDLWERSAEQGYPLALYNMGMVYLKGIHRPIDMSKVVQFWEQAVAKGNADSMFYLGQLYYEGFGVETDWERATQLWQQSEKLEFYQAKLHLAMLGLRKASQNSSQFNQQNRDQNTQWLSFLRNESATGSELANVILANIYEKGWGVEADQSMAIKHWVRAANQNNFTAIRRLGLLQAQRGSGVSQSNNYLVKAARLGDQVSQFLLATKLENTQQKAVVISVAVWYKLASAGIDPQIAAQAEKNFAMVNAKLSQSEKQQVSSILADWQL